jgi:hypothetical protein
MLIVALVMAVIGLAALVTAVVTSNEIIAWVCIGASVIGVVLLIIDALRERQKRDTTPAADSAADEEEFDAEYPDEEAESPDEEAPPDEEASLSEEADRTEPVDPESTEKDATER